MGKTYKKVNREKIILNKVTCDRCKADCTNTHIDLLLKYSFRDKTEELETVCYSCYEELFESTIRANRINIFKNTIRANRINIFKKRC